VRGIRIRFSITYSLISLKNKRNFEEENYLTPPHPNPLPARGLREKAAHPLGLAETHG